MEVRFKGGSAIVVRRMDLDRDAEQVIALVNSRIAADEKEGRGRRLGPISQETLTASFEEFSGLSTVLADSDSGEIVGCALVTVFEPVEAAAVEPDPWVAEAAKLTVAEALFGTRAATILHALRIVGVALVPRLGGLNLTLYYNVLSGNDRQLEYVDEFALRAIAPDGYVGAVLEQRRMRLNLGGQEIRSFTFTDESLKRALKVLLEAAADRLLSRSNRSEPSPVIEVWALRFEHPLLSDLLGVLVTMADELQVPVPKQVRTRSGSPSVKPPEMRPQD